MKKGVARSKRFGCGVAFGWCDLDWRAQLQAGQQIALGALYAVLPCTHTLCGDWRLPPSGRKNRARGGEDSIS